MNMANHQELLKEAAGRIKTLTLQNQDAVEKLAESGCRKEAEKVAWEMVDKGLSEPYSSMTDFDSKVEAIMSKGAAIVRAGMDLAPNISKDFGTLSIDKVAGADIDPLTAFVLSGD